MKAIFHDEPERSILMHMKNSFVHNKREQSILPAYEPEVIILTII